MNFSNINVLKHEESDKASVDSTHTEGACGGESIDSPTVSILHSPTIDVEYVFVSSNTITNLKIVKFISEIMVFYNFIISIGYELT